MLPFDNRASTLHPRLTSTRANLTQQWADSGFLSIDSVLAPGLAAELDVALSALPLGLHIPREPGESGLHWRCDAQLSPAMSAKSPLPLLRLQRFLGADLPALLSAVTAPLPLPLHR